MYGEGYKVEIVDHISKPPNEPRPHSVQVRMWRLNQLSSEISALPINPELLLPAQGRPRLSGRGTSAQVVLCLGNGIFALFLYPVYSNVRSPPTRRRRRLAADRRCGRDQARVAPFVEKRRGRAPSTTRLGARETPVTQRSIPYNSGTAYERAPFLPTTPDRASITA